MNKVVFFTCLALSSTAFARGWGGHYGGARGYYHAPYGRPFYHPGGRFIYPYGPRGVLYPWGARRGFYAYNGIVPFYAFGAFVLAVDLSNNLYLASEAERYNSYPYTSYDMSFINYNNKVFTVQRLVFNNNGAVQQVWVVTDKSLNVVLGTYPTKDAAYSAVYAQQ